ncbi:MAG: hypothetical protein IJD04_03365 [Desulfovibrionaceae bacterium]|nr:hypothetical protein [Desulfovibrionaceae bacterium]
MLVNAGYAFGIGGFPKERSLSLFFVSNELAACNEDFIETMKKSVGSAFFLKSNKYGCSFARQSPYMPIFKEPGLLTSMIFTPKSVL